MGAVGNGSAEVVVSRPLPFLSPPSLLLSPLSSSKNGFTSARIGTTASQIHGSPSARPRPRERARAFPTERRHTPSTPDVAQVGRECPTATRAWWWRSAQPDCCIAAARFFRIDSPTDYHLAKIVLRQKRGSGLFRCGRAFGSAGQGDLRLSERKYTSVS